VILYGSLITFIASLAGWGYARLVGPRVVSPPSAEFAGQSFVDRGLESQLPSTWSAYAPIIIRSCSSPARGWRLATKGAHRERRDDVPRLAGGCAVRRRTARLSQHATGAGRCAQGAWVEALATSSMIIMVTGLGGR
jgi:hypothetical protein